MEHENQLSKREMEVASLLVQGKSNKQIAMDLNITERTVESHLTKIYEKLQVRSRMEAFAKLRETTGIFGDSTIDNAGKMSIIKSDKSEPDSNKKDSSNVTRRVSLAEIIRFLVLYRFPIFTWLLLFIIFVFIYALSNRTAWKYQREGEYPDEYTVGMVLQRSDASAQMVHGQFGTVPAWPAQPGYVKYYIETPGTSHLLLRLRYSKHSASDVFIFVYLDDETKSRAKILPVNQSDWNKFIWTDKIDLGEVKRGVHSIKFYTEGQVYGVADLDKFELTTGTP